MYKIYCSFSLRHMNLWPFYSNSAYCFDIYSPHVGNPADSELYVKELSINTHTVHSLSVLSHVWFSPRQVVLDLNVCIRVPAAFVKTQIAGPHAQSF